MHATHVTITVTNQGATAAHPSILIPPLATKLFPGIMTANFICKPFFFFVPFYYFFFIFQKLIFRMYCDNWWPSESAQPPTAKITSWLINYTYSSVCEHPVKGWTNCLETIRLNNSFGPCTHAKFSSYKKPIHFCP